MLCRHHDENTTKASEPYEFQQRQDETAEELVDRIQTLCKAAAKEAGTMIDAPFDKLSASPKKLAFAIRELEGISFTKNAYSSEADVLGDFFEATLGSEFKQGKGQFFTHKDIARFALSLAGLDESAAKALRQGSSPEWPLIIDPSCGSGTFLIEALRKVCDSARVFKEHEPKLSTKEVQALDRLNDPSLIRQWADGLFYGIDAHKDLSLGCKVNMLMHKASAQHIFSCDALSTLGPDLVAKMGTFDLVATNPPFSVTLSEEERSGLRDEYTLLQGACRGRTVASEHLFLERWHSLLKKGGSVVAVVPSSLLDVASHGLARKFLYQHFNLEAVIALPAVTFQPYTGTTTVVLLARKKTAAEVSLWKTAMEQASMHNGEDENACFLAAFQESAGTKQVFMAEPKKVGYKRRSGKQDLVTEDDLFGSGEASARSQTSVMSRWRAGYEGRSRPDRRLGFWVPLANLADHSSLRADPKYMWHWSVCKGAVFGDVFPTDTDYAPLSDLLTITASATVPKGKLDPPRAYVEAKSMGVPKITQLEDNLGPKKEFGDAELAFHRIMLSVLRNDPKEDWIGATSWILFNTTDAVCDVDFVHALLLSKPFQEAASCIQTGLAPKNMSPKDLLALKVPLPNMERQRIIGGALRVRLDTISQLKDQLHQECEKVEDTLLEHLRR